MNQVREMIEQGGAVMIAIALLAIVLYAHCLQLCLNLHRMSLPGAPSFSIHALQDYFKRQRIFLETLIAAAPLIGLFGTVVGMLETFASISAEIGQDPLEGIARGIKFALITTEAGLGVAIPGLIFLYIGDRLYNRLLLNAHRAEVARFKTS